MSDPDVDLPSTLPDREFQKFTTDADGQTAVRIAPGAVTDTEGHELDIDEAGRAQMNNYSVNILLGKILCELQLVTKELKKINSKG